MNKLITKHVLYRGQLVPVESLKDSSNIKVVVECPHGQRVVRWSRRNQLCRLCAAERGLYSTSKPGREVYWGDKISAAKKNVKLTEEHRRALIRARREKLARKLNKPPEEVEFPTKSPQYKLRVFMMSLLRKSILRTSIEEQDKLILEKLGYTVEDLKRHLESQFEPWMTWDNYGEWEIDHVRPDSWFSYDSLDSDELKRSLALSNLQPVSASDNRRKSNLYSGKVKERVLYMLCGQSGVGKSTVASKLHDMFTVLDKDDFRRVKDLDKVIRNSWHNDLPVLLQVGFHISSTIERYRRMGYKVVPLFIIEEPDVVINRIIARGGSRVSNVRSRHERMLTLSSRYAVHSATADDMLQYIRRTYGKETT